MAVNKLGAGTSTLSGTNSYSGATTIGGGTLRAGNANAFGTGNITVGANAVLDLGGFAIPNFINNSSGGTILNANGIAVTQTGGTLNGSISGGTLNGSIAGTISASGNISGTPTFTGTLKGSGTVFADTVTFSNGAIHAPGNSPGIQTFASGVTYLTGSTLQFEFIGDALTLRGTDYDAVNVTGGDLTVQAGASLALISSAVDYTSSSWNMTRNFTVIMHSGAGTSTGNFDLKTTLAGSFTGEGNWSVANSSGDIVLTWTPVPEPTTYAALAGLAALGFAWKRRRFT